MDSLKADPLTVLALKYGADKAPQIKHGYTPFYYGLFKDKRESVKKVLEIGAGEGASLRMWREFFPNAMIYGADNQDNRLFEERNIKVIKCDQSRGNDLRLLIAIIGFDLDLVIDDGSHRESDQFFTCLTLMPWLNKNVTYVIEDVDKESKPSTKLLKKYDWIILEFGKRHDDRVIVVRHKNG
jgi:8-demethyl-8-alpha-L-rhamnosyltetracenomycin-C 2'-O-methyltransferase